MVTQCRIFQRKGKPDAIQFCREDRLRGIVAKKRDNIYRLMTAVHRGWSSRRGRKAEFLVDEFLPSVDVLSSIAVGFERIANFVTPLGEGLPVQIRRNRSIQLAVS
jgi:hypothetical protein